MRFIVCVFVLSTFLCSTSLFSRSESELPIVIVTASYNNKQWYEWNLGSIFAQNYHNFRLIYIEDRSTDGTAELVKAWIKERKVEDRVTLIINESRRGHMANQYDAIHNHCKNNEIVVIVDGDDWFAHANALARINKAYQEGAWLTYGQFWYWKKDRIGVSKEVPCKVLQEGTIRQLRPWHTSHLRTFYAGLYKEILFQDLLYEGKFFPMCVDVATMLPMIEMAGEHAVFISDILYIYNDDNSLNFYHDHRLEQQKIEKEIRAKTPYQKLEELSF